jgi:hypothetical protein
VFEFGGHSEDDWPQGVACGANRIGDLFGMAAVLTLSAARTIAGLHVELSDDRNYGWQIGLILNHHAWFDEWNGAVGTSVARDFDNPVDAFRGRRRTKGRRMALTTARFLLAFLELVTAKRSRLPIGLTPGRGQFFTEPVVFVLEFSILMLKLAVFLLKQRISLHEIANFIPKSSDFAVALLTGFAGEESHNDTPFSGLYESVQQRCVVVVYLDHTNLVKRSEQRKSISR